MSDFPARTGWSTVACVLVVMLAGCGTGDATRSRPGAGAEADAAGETVRRLFVQGWNRQVYDGLEGTVADGTIFHIHGKTRETGFDDMKRLVAYWHRTFDGFRAAVEDVVSEGDRVAVRLTFSGRHVGVWHGIQPSGAEIEFTAMMFFRFENGRIVEIWEEYDEAGLVRQLSDER